MNTRKNVTTPGSNDSIPIAMNKKEAPQIRAEPSSSAQSSKRNGASVAALLTQHPPQHLHYKVTAAHQWVATLQLTLLQQRVVDLVTHQWHCGARTETGQIECINITFAQLGELHM